MSRIFVNYGIARRAHAQKVTRITQNSSIRALGGHSFGSRDFLSDDFAFNDSRDVQFQARGHYQREDPRGFGNRDGGFASSLKPIKWSPQDSEPFVKDFYKDREFAHIKDMSPEEVARIRSEASMTVTGENIPNPVNTFEETTLDEVYLNHIRKMGLTEPSAIQKQGIPMALSGRDLIGVSKTGSGKTLAFILPAIVHINAQPALRPGDGPICLVLSPTRELAVQIGNEVKKLSSTEAGRISHTCVYGGAARSAQISQLRRQPDILIATPGRLLDFLECGAVTLRRTTYLVLDEADRMLEMGFQQDLEKILSQCRPDRQTLMFSATWPKEVRHIATKYTAEDSIRVQIGSLDLSANQNITQTLTYVESRQKDNQFLQDMNEIQKKGQKCLVFSNTKKNCDRLCNMLLNQRIPADAIHGDRSQAQRDMTMKDFRMGRTKVMIATDVVARGIDIRDIKVVLNYDMPTEISSYVHRIGRTARGNDTGDSIAYMESSDISAIGKDLKDVLARANQEIPAWFTEKLANTWQSSPKSYSKHSRNNMRAANHSRRQNY